MFGFRTEPLCSVLDLVRTENNAGFRTEPLCLVLDLVRTENNAEIRTIRFERSDFGIMYWRSYAMNAEIRTIK